MHVGKLIQQLRLAGALLSEDDKAGEDEAAQNDEEDGTLEHGDEEGDQPGADGGDADRGGTCTGKSAEYLRERKDNFSFA
ncbi:hypothetical protein BH11CYA1_BH11CYA1_34820 [soil metagenome]